MSFYAPYIDRFYSTSGGGGGGDVVGPGSSFQYSIAMWADATGKLLYSSAASASPEGYINANALTFSATPTRPGLVLKNLTAAEILALSSAAYPGAVAYATDTKIIYYSNVTGWQILNNTNVSPNFGYVTIGGVTAQYPKLSDALAAGKNKFWQIGTYTETSDVDIVVSDDFSVICNPGVIAVFADASLRINNSIANLYWKGGTLYYSMSVAPKNWLQYFGVGKANSFFSDCIIQDVSTQAGSYWNDNPVGGTVQIFNNVQWFLPDLAGCGPRIGGGTSTVMRMTGGGTSCSDIMTVISANVTGIVLNGAFSTSPVITLSDCTFSNAYIGSNSGTPLARISVLGSCALNNVIAKSDAGWRLVTIGENVSINNFISGGIGSLFTGSGSDSLTVSNSVISDTTISTSPFAPVFDNVHFAQATTLTVQADAATLANCKFDNDVLISAHNVTLSNFKVGEPGGTTYTVTIDSGIFNTNLIGGYVEVPVVNNGDVPSTDSVGVKLWH